MKTVHVSLGQESYDVWIGNGILQNLPRWLGPADSRAIVVIHDSKLSRDAGFLCQALRRNGFRVHVLEKRSGENLKTWVEVGRIYDELAGFALGRDSILIALGGGVIGDVTGFVAGTYLRGISWISVPTTLLAQVDSSVGGKTGMNLKFGKNLVGLFHQPRLVICDTAFLRTLPRREFNSGLGEILKYGLLARGRSSQRIKKALRGKKDLSKADLTGLIQECLKIKIAIVERDPRETREIRQILNLGHTFAHALESTTGFRRFRHGEAVYLGLKAAIELSKIRGHLSGDSAAALLEDLPKLRIPDLPRALRTAKILRAMKNDKKAREGRPRFVLLNGQGAPLLDSTVTDAEIAESLRASGISPD